MENTLTAVFEKVQEGYIGYVEELPGANTQGKTLEEARKNLKEAIELVFESNRQLVEEENQRERINKRTFLRKSHREDSSEHLTCR